MPAPEELISPPPTDGPRVPVRYPDEPFRQLAYAMWVYEGRTEIEVMATCRLRRKLFASYRAQDGWDIEREALVAGAVDKVRDRLAATVFARVKPMVERALAASDNLVAHVDEDVAKSRRSTGPNRMSPMALGESARALKAAAEVGRETLRYADPRLGAPVEVPDKPGAPEALTVGVQVNILQKLHEGADVARTQGAPDSARTQSVPVDPLGAVECATKRETKRMMGGKRGADKGEGQG